MTPSIFDTNAGLGADLARRAGGGLPQSAGASLRHTTTSV
jgi:hypothetical protein